MPQKRKQCDEKLQERISAALAVKGASERATREIWNLAQPAEGSSLSSKQFGKHVDEALEPSHCFDILHLPSKRDSPEAFPVANIPKLLRFIGSRMPALSGLLKDRLQHSSNLLSPLIYHDEAQAGNILAVHKK